MIDTLSEVQHELAMRIICGRTRLKGLYNALRGEKRLFSGLPHYRTVLKKDSMYGTDLDAWSLMKTMPVCLSEALTVALYTLRTKAQP